MHVDAEGFADGVLIADDVEDVVLDLEGGAEGKAVEAHGVHDRIGCAGALGTEEAAACAEDGGFLGDDLDVGFFVEVEVVAIVDLEEFAFADPVGGAADDAGGEL